MGLPVVPDRVECIALEEYHRTRYRIEDQAAKLYERAELHRDARARRKIAAYHKERAESWGKHINKAPAAGYR